MCLRDGAAHVESARRSPPASNPALAAEMPAIRALLPALVVAALGSFAAGQAGNISAVLTALAAVEEQPAAAVCRSMLQSVSFTRVDGSKAQCCAIVDDGRAINCRSPPGTEVQIGRAHV